MTFLSFSQGLEFAYVFILKTLLRWIFLANTVQMQMLTTLQRSRSTDKPEGRKEQLDYTVNLKLFFGAVKKEKK